MCPEHPWIQSHAADPLGNEPRILARCHVAVGTTTAREQELSGPFVGGLQIVGDGLAGFKPRAPVWMQDAGLEWVWRACLEPKRLGWRYLKTNPLALYLLLVKSG